MQLKKKNIKNTYLKIEEERKNLGNYGERTALNFLKKKGYEILEKNYRVGHKEIDLIVQKSKTTVFVEIKTRSNSSFQKAIDALSSKQIKTLKRAIMAYSCLNKINLNLTRMDLVAIDVNKKEKKANIKHIKGII
ncbi:YraN family protein [bacterium]|nr:YraN family protein [bacterium]